MSATESSHATLSIPMGGPVSPPLRQPSFWTIQVVGWFLLNALYFREPIEAGLREQRFGLTAAMVGTSWVAAVGGSAVLATVYLRLPRSWLTGIGVVPTTLGLSLLAALPWAVLMTVLVFFGTAAPPVLYGSWMLFHASVLMLAWSGLFLWVTRHQRTEGVTLTSTAELTRTRWGLDHRVCLQEGKRVRFCLVRDIAYIQAAGDYTEVHLSNGHVAIVSQRLRDWESRLPESFIRIHRSTLINLDLGEELVHLDGAWRFRLRGCADPLAVSRRLEQEVMAKAVGPHGTVAAS